VSFVFFFLYLAHFWWWEFRLSRNTAKAISVNEVRPRTSRKGVRFCHNGTERVTELFFLSQFARDFLDDFRAHIGENAINDARNFRIGIKIGVDVFRFALGARGDCHCG